VLKTIFLLLNVVSNLCVLTSCLFYVCLVTIEHFKEALSLTREKKAREVISCQIDRTQQQILSVTNKKAQKIQSIEDKIRKRKSVQEEYQLQGKGDKITGKFKNMNINDGYQAPGIKTRIIRAMEEHDSLLQVLSEKHELQKVSVTKKESFPGSSSSSSSIPESVKSGTKVAKDDKTIIEELKTSNEHLRLLITQLVSQLEIVQTENQLLNKKISMLESECQSNRETVCSLPQLPPLDTPQLFY
jgi:hypothetical protein